MFLDQGNKAKLEPISFKARNQEFLVEKIPKCDSDKRYDLSVL